MTWERPLEPPDCWPRVVFGIGSSGYSSFQPRTDFDEEEEEVDDQ